MYYNISVLKQSYSRGIYLLQKSDFCNSFLRNIIVSYVIGVFVYYNVIIPKRTLYVMTRVVGFTGIPRVEDVFIDHDLRDRVRLSLMT